MTASRAASVTLPAATQILITREFGAPRHLVFLAWTTPELIRRWWSGGQGEVTSVEVDLRPGGRWRYVLVAEGGTEAAFHGEYREIVPDERIVSTEVSARRARSSTRRRSDVTSPILGVIAPSIATGRSPAPSA